MGRYHRNKLLVLSYLHRHQCPGNYRRVAYVAGRGWYGIVKITSATSSHFICRCVHAGPDVLQQQSTLLCMSARLLRSHDLSFNYFDMVQIRKQYDCPIFQYSLPKHLCHQWVFVVVDLRAVSFALVSVYDVCMDCRSATI